MGHIAPVDSRVHKLPKSLGERQLTHRLLSNEHRMSNRQCVSLAKLAVEDFRSVRCWRRGVQVLAARLPTGTPIATFMDRKGEDSEFYDGRTGIGAPGNMTTHAAILIDYIENETGFIEAILVLDQHALLSGFRRMIYPVDPSAFGTATATNYYSIYDEEGVQLGGATNPCWAHTPPELAAHKGLMSLDRGFSDISI